MSLGPMSENAKAFVNRVTEAKSTNQSNQSKQEIKDSITSGVFKFFRYVIWSIAVVAIESLIVNYMWNELFTSYPLTYFKSFLALALARTFFRSNIKIKP